MSTASYHAHHLNGISGLSLIDDNHNKHYQVKLAHILFHHHFCHIILHDLLSCEPSTKIFWLLGNTVGTKILLCKIKLLLFLSEKTHHVLPSIQIEVSLKHWGCSKDICITHPMLLLDSKRNATSNFQTISILQPCIQKVGAQNCMLWIYTTPYHCNQVSTFI